MVTPEEIAGVALFAALDPAQCERLSRGWPRTSASWPASTPRPRAPSARCSRCSRDASSRPGWSTGSSASSASASPATSSARSRSCSGRCSRSASARRSRRASCGSSRRLPRRRGRRPGRRQGGRPARGAPDGRVARAAGHRGRAAAPARDRRRASLGRVLHRAAALPRPQPGHVQVAHARRAGRGGRVGRPLPAEADWPAIRVVDGKTVIGRSSAGSRSCSASAPRPTPPSTTR